MPVLHARCGNAQDCLSVLVQAPRTGYPGGDGRSLSMTQPEQMVTTVQAALERSPGVDLHDSSVRLAQHDDLLVMQGEVRDIITKRIAHLTATRLLGADRVRDELCVAPAEQRSDAEIAGSLDELLMQERAFRDYPKQVLAGPAGQLPQTGAVSRDMRILASVHAAVVTLEGTVGSLTHRRLAEVLAWWSPGTCCVRNFLHVVPAEQDSDAELSDALRIVLEKDPWLDADAISIRVKDRVVTLQGLAPSQEQCRMASQDAWYIPGVHGVDNQLQVRPQAP
jgi:osmotically-inducible protein OsmY